MPCGIDSFANEDCIVDANGNVRSVRGLAFARERVPCPLTGWKLPVTAAVCSGEERLGRLMPSWCARRTCGRCGASSRSESVRQCDWPNVRPR